MFKDIKVILFIASFANLAIMENRKILITAMFVIVVISKINLFIVMIANSALKKIMSPSIWIVNKIDF